MKLVDNYLAALNPLWNSRLTGVIEDVRPLARCSAAIVIRPGRGWTGHRAGQFVTLGVDVEGVRHQRCYSITSPEGDPSGRIEIGVAAVPGGVVSNHLVHGSRPGELVTLDGPAGDFTLPHHRPSRLLLISGGSGITPIIGVLRTLAVGGRRCDVRVLHHAPDAGSSMYGAELESLAAAHRWLSVQVIHTRTGGAHLSAARLDALCPDWSEREAYVCGPESLLDFALERWSGAGAAERLHVERFTPSGLLTGGTSTGTATIRFARSGVEVAAESGATLLDLAESAGVAAPSGCRMGICHTCSTRLDAGCAQDLRDGRLVEPGSHVQLCVSAALGDLTLDI